MNNFPWDDLPTSNGAVLARATKALEALKQGTLSLDQLTLEQRYALFAPVPNCLREVLGWFRKYDTTPPTNPDPWAAAIYPALSAVDGLMPALIQGYDSKLKYSLSMPKTNDYQALDQLYDTVSKQLLDQQNNARDPQFWDYSQDFEHAVNLIKAVKDLIY